MHTNQPTIKKRPRRGCGWTSVVGCLCLLIANTEALGSSLIQHNLVSAPFPSTYSKSALARLDRKVAPPAQKKLPQTAPRQIAAVATVPAEKDTLPARSALRREARPEENPALLDALIGSNDSANSRTNVKIGYGRMVADNSDTVGRRNGTRLEEPGCFYVKTTVHF
jgi:hypothetical protein